MRRCRGAMRKASRAAARRPGSVVGVLLLMGVIASLAIPGNIYRGWFALAAFIFSVAFVAEYARRNWRSTFAGRATMISVIVTCVYTANAVLFLWWPYPSDGEYGYPHWEDVTGAVLLFLALSALYKLLALWRAGDVDEDDAKPERDPEE